jgi:hypothetical protein
VSSNRVGSALAEARPEQGPDLRLVTSVVGGEVVKRVGFVLFGGQAVLPGGVQAGVPHELGDYDQVGLAAQTGRERVPQDMC